MDESKVDRLCSHYDWLARLSTSIRQKTLARDVDFGDEDGPSVGGKSCGTCCVCRVSASEVTEIAKAVEASRVYNLLWLMCVH